KLGPVLKSVKDAQRAHPGFFIGEFGYASAAKETDAAFADDLKSAGVFSIPLTLIILVIAFGALVAAGIPLLLGLTAVGATFGLIAIPSHLVPVAFEAYAMVLLIGLAVGVDYSMFYLKRERQERAAGRSERAAVVDRVLRRPVLSAVVAAGLLLALAAPALQLRIAPQGPDSFPASLDAIKTYKRMQQAVPSAALPAQVVVEAPNVNAPAVQAA